MAAAHRHQFSSRLPIRVFSHQTNLNKSQIRLRDEWTGATTSSSGATSRGKAAWRYAIALAVFARCKDSRSIPPDKRPAPLGGKIGRPAAAGRGDRRQPYARRKSRCASGQAPRGPSPVGESASPFASHAEQSTLCRATQSIWRAPLIWRPYWGWMFCRSSKSGVA